MSNSRPDWKTTIDEWSIEIACGTLQNYLAAIRTWSEGADSNLDERIEEFKLAHGGEIPEGCDFSDVAFDIHWVEQSMYGGLAVAIASAAERYVKPRIKRERDRTKTKADAEANVARMDGHGSYNRARILGNCFKHAEGRVTEDYVNAFADGLSEGEGVNFHNEDWQAIIDGTQRLMMFIVRNP